MSKYNAPTWAPRNGWQRLLFRKGDDGWYWTWRAELFYRVVTYRG